MIIQEAGVEQLETVVALSRTTFIETFAGSNDAQDLKKYVEDNLTEARLEEEMLVPGSIFYLARVKGAAAAYMKINFVDAQTEKDFPDSLEIQRIYVLGQYKNQSIGKQLIHHAFQVARQHGVRSVWLGVWEKNVSAIGFYELMGFRKVGQHSFQLGHDTQTDHLMRFDLDDTTSNQSIPEGAKA